jgi:O-antigen/teichoic acid export membrane protein
MNNILVSITGPEKRFRLRAALGDPLGFWSQVRSRAEELSWVLSGKFGLMGANALLMLFLVHRLELKNYGLLVITISAQLLISRLLMMGVDAGMIRLGGVPELYPRFQQVVTAGLIVMLCTTCILLLISLPVALILFRFAVPVWVLASVVAGAIGTSLVDYGYSFRLARREYPLAALAQGGTALWRLGLTALTAILLPGYVLFVFIAYHGASLLSGAAQAATLIRGGQIWPERELVRRLLRYSLWQGKANVIVIFSLYQGTFLLTLVDTQAATGLFGLALTLSLGFFAIYNAYFEYLLARTGSIDNITGLSHFLTRAFGGALILALACVPVTFALAILIPRLLRPELSRVVPIFCYLAASMVLLILQSPLEVACHYFLRPKLVTLGWVVRAVSIGVAGLILAPRMGAIGAAIAQLIGSAVALVFLASLVARVLHSARAAALAEPKGAAAAVSSFGV